MKEYYIYVNRNKIKVDKRIYIAHCTHKIKRLKTLKEYNEFIRTFKFQSSNELVNFLIEYIDIPNITPFKLSKCINKKTRAYCLKSLLFSSWIGDYIKKFNLVKHYAHRKIHILFVFTEKINYINKELYSSNFLKIESPLHFYNNLLTTYSLKTLKPSSLITPRMINNVLQEYNLKEEDIRKDLIRHHILIYKEEENYYTWADSLIPNWLWNTKSSILNLLSLDYLMKDKRS